MGKKSQDGRSGCFRWAVRTRHLRTTRPCTHEDYSSLHVSSPHLHDVSSKRRLSCLLLHVCSISTFNPEGVSRFPDYDNISPQGLCFFVGLLANYELAPCPSSVFKYDWTKRTLSYHDIDPLAMSTIEHINTESRPQYPGILCEYPRAVR